MNCTKCGKEIPDDDKLICDECKENFLNEIEQENQEEIKNQPIAEEKNKSKKGKKIIIGFISIIIIVALIISVFNVISRGYIIPNKEGNTIANIRNYGYTATQGEWVYYTAPSEDATSISIYKAKKDGTEKQELVKDTWTVLGLNVSGNYIYFIGIFETPVQSSATLDTTEAVIDTLNNNIYRMKTDGTELEIINSNEFHDNCYEIYVIDKKIYYIGVDANIYYMDLDGSNKTKLNDDKTGFLGITKDYIILNLEKKSEENKEENTVDNEVPQTNTTIYETCIMNIDGTDKKTLTGERLYSINVVDEYIYYINADKSIYKIKVDGTDKTLISDKVIAYNLNVTKDKIYYMSSLADNPNKLAIYTMNLDGSDNKMVYELYNYSSFLNIVDDKIVFMDSTEKSATMNMINSDGSENIYLYELKAEDLIGTTDNSNNESTPNETTENTTESTVLNETTENSGQKQ